VDEKATDQELANFEFTWVVYNLTLNSDANSTMTKNSRRRQAATAILFSLILSCPLALGGLLAGMYLWGHFGPPSNDPDDTDGYLCGVLVGGVMAIGGGMTLLWKFWPRATQGTSQSS
jgi:hypothetical protein